MNGSALVCVLTTIQPPTACVHRLSEVLGQAGGRLVVVGDRKGPQAFPLDSAEFFPLADQQRLPFRLASLLPTGHYARKNLGYLIAASSGATCLYETDDDNSPADSWQPRSCRAVAQPVAPRPWMNAYGPFTDQLVWPRGFPLEQVTDPATREHDASTALCEVEA